MKHYDVVIVGGGPVGLIGALTLAQQGCKVAVIEKRAGLNQKSKASTFHAPTLEILARLGVYDAFASKAQHIDRLQYRTPTDGILGELPYILLDGLTKFPCRKHLEQSLLTPILLEKLRTFPHATYHFYADYLTLQQDATNVHVSYINRQTGKTENLSCQFVLAADGAHSRVRETLGLAFEGKTYSGFQLRLRCDNSICNEIEDLGPVTYLVGPNHSASFLYMGENWRIILRVPEGTSEEEALIDDWALHRLRGLIPHFHLPNILDKDCYGARMAAASCACRGRVFLAGDALHLTNTRGGMNMNCGIHDGFFLGLAMSEALKNNNPALVIDAAKRREWVTKQMLLPRTDELVSGEQSWIERTTDLLCDEEKGRTYLAQTAMLDMVDFT